ncbi:class I SAM-dependent methyltransferase [Paenibacillus cymbidii]|uniref:class I SAM-dependent methyltransferase n=1 Tax=Paenibacillus cymbidii TaxID=1639034 RepID=UPI001080D6C0|nr:class I SAM-dependent methyltransferase [Paenibacillus cymbidii]
MSGPNEHYYTAKPTGKRDLHTIVETLRGTSFTFQSDAGVFAKKGVDYGSCALIEAMELADDSRVLDVGCGYGPIGLAAAKAAPRGHVTMLDINERAVELARDNAARNGIGNVTVLQSDLLERVSGERFDVIVSNPPIRAGKAVVHRLFEQASDRLRPGGCLWIVIQKKQGAPSAMAKLETLFPNVRIVDKDKGYWVIRAEKEAAAAVEATDA